MQETMQMSVKGHCKIVDDLGTTVLDKDNAVHPANLARVFARALANEPNGQIYRIAFGNGGTTLDATNTVTYKKPNDGQSPDVATWDSRLYNETFSKIIDIGEGAINPKFGTDPGSADINTGVRPGGGSAPESDPTTVPHISGPGVRSNELGLTSEVVITCVLNKDEPKAQYTTDGSLPSHNIDADFVFDEIALYSAGLQSISTNGYQYADVGNKISTDDTGLLPSTNYEFSVVIDGGSVVLVQFTTPAAGSGGAGEILYGDLCEAINTGDVAWGLTGIPPIPSGAKMSITDYSNGVFSTIMGSQTYGYLAVTSSSVGTSSSVDLTQYSPSVGYVNLFDAINPPSHGVLQTPVTGTNAGVRNNPADSTLERERLLAMLTFSPILKAANRSYTITYTLTISIARTPDPV